MVFALIICTYKRSQPLLKLLLSVQHQTLHPNEILIVDGSPDDFTKEMLTQNSFQGLKYFKVDDKDRGLTKQRNYGIARVQEASEVVCFLDDDTVLESNYFEEIIKTYTLFPEALGVGGYITNETNWTKTTSDYQAKANEFYYDGWKRKDGSRFVWRKKLGLDSNRPPGCLPEFSHGRSIGFLPPSGKIYEVEQLMGGVSSFRKSVFKEFQFSTYFEGYGLYEDADFTLRLSKVGKLYINTNAQLGHYHDASGRPNKYDYGKMVVRNGYYVWRVKYPNPSFKAKIKWHLITLLLTAIRFTNVATKSKRKEALTETLGRISGWFTLFFNPPI
ncbi:glycosyltransferase family 2 protein [Flavobacterium cheniae]|uniref:GT2 family glycosyltransferase n=1 Tax=Flavobacterium cheniae TaxID=295428 RepID=A0A562KP59_9FLAO|nr:glycosyltransferase [Flavobacterium cheniae]TDR22964.1 GT2 family glycosyltransferase [Flavobacterium cheniae]TWH97176.1 GT2 family glycosyltransferase [Flavobacterium cheniae]